MNLMRRQTLWTAICVATAALGTTATNAEFIDDSQVQLKLRNFYLDRQYETVPQNNWGSWSQGIILDAKSGYAELGGLQLGADLLVQHTILDAQGRPKFIFTTYIGAEGGAPCLVTEYVYASLTSSIVIGRQERVYEWKAAWDPGFTFDPTADYDPDGDGNL